MIDVNMYLPDMQFQPDEYQVEGTSEIVNKKNFFIADKPGSGKSKQSIDAACILFRENLIDTVVIVCPAQVKIGWANPDFGEIQKHAFVKSMVCEFSSKRPIIPQPSPDTLVWAIVSYEFGRASLYEKMLAGELRGRKIMFIFDESIRLANWRSLQHKVFKKLAHHHGDRIVELNGTPGDPIDLYGQFDVLDPGIIGCQNFYHFQARYCIMVPISKGSPIKKVKEFVNKDLLDARIKPFILRREPPVGVRRIDQIVSVPLSDSTWKVYCQMRDQLIADLGEKQATVKNAMVKGIRLAQITSGLLGGIESAPIDLYGEYGAADIPDLTFSPDDERVVELSAEKNAGFLEWLKYRTLESDSLRVLVWCRFRPEIARLTRMLRANGFAVGNIVGGQSRKERELAVSEFTSGDIKKPMIIVGQQQAGGMGLNFVTCHYTFYMSNVFSHRDREQTELRTMRKGQLFDCHYTDMIATGPAGQKTIDHHILKSLREQESVATWTMSDWRRRLLDE